MRENLNALYTLVEEACSGCGYEFMCGDCTVEDCEINEAFLKLKDFIEGVKYAKD